MLSISPRSREFRAIVLVISALLSAVLYTGLVHQQLVTDPRLGEHVAKISKLGQSIFKQPNTLGGIPKKIWYKLGPKGKNENIIEWTNSCINQNPDWEHEFMTDAGGDEYVIKHFSATRPDIVEIYTNLTVPILKADLLRYLLLYIDGGMWSDLDVSCEGIPIDKWIPAEFLGKAELVVGWEFDWGMEANYIHQFTSWTILAKPRLAHMMTVINDIIESIYTAQIQHKLANVGELTSPLVGDIVDVTGPRRLTRSVVKSLEMKLKRPLANEEYQAIQQPVLIDNVLILPQYAFSILMNDWSDIGGPPGEVLLQHHYAGSWKNEHGGELARRWALPQPKRKDAL